MIKPTIDKSWKTSICDSKYFLYQDVHISTIQSLAIIAIGLIYYSKNHLSFVRNYFQLGLICLPVVMAAITFAYLFQGKKANFNKWHFLAILSVLALVFNYETTVNAQILNGIDQAIDDVGTASGGSVAANILDAVIDLIRIAIYVAVAGAVIAAIIFGVVQGQWQAPVLVVGVIIAISLFLELMGVVVFGSAGGGLLGSGNIG